MQTYFTSISHLKSGKNFSETLSKIHVFITQTGNNHPEIGTRHAGKMVNILQSLYSHPKLKAVIPCMSVALEFPH